MLRDCGIYWVSSLTFLSSVLSSVSEHTQDEGGGVYSTGIAEHKSCFF